MRVITLMGESNTGKTTTIRNVYLNLWNDETNTERISFETEGGDKCDFISILEYKRKLIVIKSLGDKNDEGENPFEWVESGLKIARLVKADILINTLNTKTLDETKYNELVSTDDLYAFRIYGKKYDEMLWQENEICKNIIDKIKSLI